MIEPIHPTVRYDQIATMYAASRTVRFANPVMTAMWSRDPGPDNPLAAPTPSGEARRPEEQFVAPVSGASDAFVPTIDILA